MIFCCTSVKFVLKMKIFLCLSVIIIITLISVELINGSSDSSISCSNKNFTLIRDDITCFCRDWRDITNGSKLYCPKTGINIKHDSKYFLLDNTLSFPEVICGCQEKNVNCTSPTIVHRISSSNEVSTKTKEFFDAIPKNKDENMCMPVTKQYDEGHLLNPEALKQLKKRQITKEDISKITMKQLQCPYELSINITSGFISLGNQGVIVYKKNYFLPGEYAVVDHVLKYERYGPNKTYKAEWNHAPEYIRGCVSDEPRNMEMTNNFILVSIVNDGCINYWIKTGNDSYRTNLLSVLGQQELRGKLYPMSNNTRWIFYKNNTQQPTCELLKEKFYDSKNVIYIILSILSVVLGITALLIYSVLKKFKEVHGCVLMCYLLGLIFMEILESVAAFDPSLIYFTRYSFTILTFFEFHSYAWLNVLCYDTYRNLTAMTTNRNNFGKFTKYLAYVLASSIFLTLIGGLLFYAWDPVYRMEGDYWFGIISFIPEMPLFTFYVASLSALSIPNVGFFVATSIYIYNTQQAVVNKIQSDTYHKKMKEQFLLHLRLFILMGLHVFIYAMELIFFLEWKTVRNLIDYYNRAQGILIFFLFIWRRQIREQLVQKYLKGVKCMRSAKIAPESTNSSSL